MNTLQENRGIEVITTEIITIKQQTVRVMAQASFEIGKRLCEAKETVPAGEWMTYLQEKLDYGVTTAENLMRSYKEYGSEQIDLLTGKSRAEIFAGFNQSQLVAMFGLEPEKCIELVESTPGIEDMSSRQIAQLAKEKKAAEDEAARERKARENADKIATEQADKAEKLKAEKDEAAQSIKDLESELERVRADLETEKAQASMIAEPDTSAQDAKISKLEEKIKSLREKEKTVKERHQAELDKAAEKARQDVLEEMQAAVAEANEKAAVAERRAEAAKDTNAVQASLIFKDIQENTEKLIAHLSEMEKNGDGRVENLRRIIAKYMEQTARRIGGEA